MMPLSEGSSSTNLTPRASSAVLTACRSPSSKGLVPCPSNERSVDRPMPADLASSACGSPSHARAALH